jgi:uncharacterized membrane-anchored protein YhcB (DUF1043 family)
MASNSSLRANKKKKKRGLEQVKDEIKSYYAASIEIIQNLEKEYEERIQ